MKGSRLSRVKSKRNSRQAMVYLLIAVLIIFGMVNWGVPAAARLAGMFVSSDPGVDQSELKPTPPVLTDIPSSTKESSVNIRGFAQPGMEIELYVNGTASRKTLTDESGVFTFEKIMVDEGDNRIYAYSVSPRGAESDQSKEYMIKVDKEPPKLTLSSPENGKVLRGVTERIVNIQGMVDEEGTRVYVGERVAIVQTDGSFSLPYQLLDGDQDITITARDPAGNEDSVSISLKFEP